MKEGEPKGDLHHEERKQKFNYKKIAVFLLAFLSSYFTFGERAFEKKTYEKGVSEVKDIMFCINDPESELCKEEFDGKDIADIVNKMKGLPDETLSYLQKAVDSLSK